MIRTKTLLLAVLAWAGGLGLAQSGRAIPLVSIGSEFKWLTESEQYRIVIPEEAANKPLNLEVYSPALNLNDYVNGRAVSGYYGDERYGSGAFSTTFTLTGPTGKVLEKTYQTSTAHTWERWIGTPLPAGTYTLKVVSSGRGKNAYALRVAAPAQIQASTFTVNARGRPDEDLLAARFRLPAELVGKQIRLLNYDGDGASELQLFALQPGGTHRPLAVSGNGSTATDVISVTQEGVGDWSIVARISTATKQFSNSFALRLETLPSPRSGEADGQPFFATLPPFADPQGAKLLGPVVVEVVDLQGRPIPGASYTLDGDTAKPVLPRGYVAVSASVPEGKGQVVGNAEVRVTAPARVRFVARPNQGGLNVETVALVGGQRIPLSGVPFQAAGQTLRSPANLPLAPGEYPVAPTPLPGASVEAKSGTVKDGQTTTVTLEYRVQVALQLLVSPDAVLACQTTNLTAIASTDFPYTLPSTLKLTLPRGFTSDAKLEASGSLSAQEALTLAAPTRVCSAGTVRASLEPGGLAAEAAVQVRSTSLTLSRVTPGGGVTLAKSLAYDGANYTVSLILTVDKAVDNLRVTDPLPAGGGTPAVRGAANLRQGQGQPSAARLEGSTFNLGKLAPGTYTVSYTLFTDLPPEKALTDPDLTWDEGK